MKNNRKILSLILAISVAISTCLMPEVVCAAASTNANFGKYNISESHIKSLINKYGYEEPKFSYSHNVFEPLGNIAKPRYKRNSKGIYSNSAKSKDKNATLLLTGDLMCQGVQQTKAMSKYGKYCFNDSFEYVKPVFASADLVVGNLETMLSESASFYSEEHYFDEKPHCNAPSTFLDALKYAGYDALVQANNHNCDTGIRGIHQTQSHLNQYGLMHTGLFDDSSESRYIIVNVDGIKVAILSYATYYNDKDWYLTEKGKDVLLNRYSKSRAKRDIAKAKKRGAEYIITYVHWGEEYRNWHKPIQTKIAKELASVGADYIVGSHPHALQEFEKIKTKKGKIVPVMYSLGNFLSNMSEYELSKDTVILKLQLKKNKGKVKLTSNSIIPCRTITDYYGNNYCTVPLTKEVRTDSKYSNETQNSYNRIKVVIGDKIKIDNNYK